MEAATTFKRMLLLCSWCGAYAFSGAFHIRRLGIDEIDSFLCHTYSSCSRLNRQEGLVLALNGQDGDGRFGLKGFDNVYDMSMLIAFIVVCF